MNAFGRLKKIIGSSTIKGSHFNTFGNSFGFTRSFSTPKVPITVAYGDGIGPEITKASLFVMNEAGAQIDPHNITIGEKLYLSGHTSGIASESWDSIRKTKVMLKGPITTPQGGGYKSLNVTIRKTLGLYANVRPCNSYAPFVETKHPKMDVVIVRENEEDLYAGIEHHQTDWVVQCLKLISRPGCEKIIGYAFEYARRNNRKKVSCFVKDNIMKMTDGLFSKIFDEIGAKYPDIERDKWIVDIGAARLADTPEIFDVIVMQNLYGDILSDIAAQISGSVGLGGSANIGVSGAMFEAIHGSAPPIAGKDIANPSGILLSGVMLLNHIGQNDVAERVHNAWLYTLENGIHTQDIFKKGVSKELVGTQAFAQAVVKNLGKMPSKLAPVSYASAKDMGSMKGWVPPISPYKSAKKEMAGVDVFVHWPPMNGSPEDLAKIMQRFNGDGFELTLLTNRGVKVWPGGFPETFCTDHWRCRFKKRDSGVNHTQIVSLLLRLANGGVDFIKTENLYILDGKPGFSLGQGE